MGNNMFAYCLNNPICHVDTNGEKVEDATKTESEDEEEFNLVGIGIQISGSGSYGVISGGGGVEVIVYWDTPEAKTAGKPIVAIYWYGEADAVIDSESLGEIVELLLESVDVMKLDGVNALEAIIAGFSCEASISISPFSVEATSEFYGVEDYTGYSQNKSINIGSITFATAWSDSCRTRSIGYTYTFGKPALYLKLPSFSRGGSSYGLIWASNLNSGR